jgi:hypothetical protein
MLSFHAVAIKEQIILGMISGTENPPSFPGFIELSIASE